MAVSACRMKLAFVWVFWFEALRCCLTLARLLRVVLAARCLESSAATLASLLSFPHLSALKTRQHLEMLFFPDSDAAVAADFKVDEVRDSSCRPRQAAND